MTRNIPAWFLVLAIVSSGCIADAPRPTGPTMTSVAGPTVLPYGLHECDFVVAVVGVEEGRLAGRVPPGFELVIGSILPGAPPSAFLGLEAFSCQGEGLGDPPTAYAYGSVFTGVRPNATLTKGDVEEYYVKWDTLVDNATKRDALRSNGIAAHDGTARVSIDASPALASILADFDMMEGGSFQIRGAGQVAPDSPGFEYIEYTPTEHGTLGAWHSTTLAQTLSVRGLGTVTVDRDSWYGAIIGQETANANIGAGRWSFAPGFITVPVESGAEVR